MSYKYSICYPDKEKIEYPEDRLTDEQVMEKVRNYPWIAQLNLMNTLPAEKAYYNPSIDFTSIETEHSFCLTAEEANNELQFSIWYNRPVKVKSFLGLFGEKTKLEVTDKFGFNAKTAFNYLQLFLEQDYQKIEQLMTK